MGHWADGCSAFKQICDFIRMTMLQFYHAILHIIITPPPGMRQPLSVAPKLVVSHAGHGGADEDRQARLAERYAVCLSDIQVLWDLRGEDEDPYADGSAAPAALLPAAQRLSWQTDFRPGSVHHLTQTKVAKDCSLYKVYARLSTHD